MDTENRLVVTRLAAARATSLLRSALTCASAQVSETLLMNAVEVLNEALKEEVYRHIDTLRTPKSEVKREIKTLLETSGYDLLEELV